MPPIYLINTEDESAQGPFESKTDVGEAFDSESDDSFLVIVIGEDGIVSLVENAVDFLEAEEGVA